MNCWLFKYLREGFPLVNPNIFLLYLSTINS